MIRSAIVSSWICLMACGSDSADKSGTQTPTRPGASTADPSTPAPDAGSLTNNGKGAPYPVVLLHGMAGFVSLGSNATNDAGGLDYFNGIVDSLVRDGESEVFATRASPYTTSEARAAELAPQIEQILKQTGRAKVNLVGHSQGGLDARVLASPQGLNLGAKIASVTSIATPHLGTKLSDLSVGASNGATDAAAAAFLSVLQKSVYDLNTDPNLKAQVEEISEKHMLAVFNPKYKNAQGVVYESYAGRTNLRSGIGFCDNAALPNEPTKLDPVSGHFQATAIYLEGGLPPKVNDGLVTVESAKWGTFVQCVPADHLKQVGIIGVGFDQKAFFADVVKRIRRAGL